LHRGFLFGTPQLPHTERNAQDHDGKRHSAGDPGPPAAVESSHLAQEPVGVEEGAARWTTGPSSDSEETEAVKPVIIIAFIMIFGSLVGAGYFIVRDRGKSRNTAWALTARVGLSVALFLFIWFAHWMGWIQSTGLPVGR
jgi:hypothetical protein